MLKRGFDISVIILTGPIWIPVILFIAIGVRIGMGPPVLFRQRRPGLKGKVFELVKFRTMIDASSSSGEVLPDGERITTFGKWLRSTSLDELPEIWNILRGEMSLVGPRPLLVEYLPRYNVRQAGRHKVRPGLTGLAQIMGRNALSWEEKFEWDICYVETRNFWLDLKIIGLTVCAVLFRKNINARGESTMREFKPLSDKADL